MRVVVDTNVLVSGLLYGGLPGEVVDSAKHGLVTLCVTESTVKELKATLGYPKFERHRQLLSEPIEIVLKNLLGRADFVPELLDMPDVIQIDPDDTMFLACALTAEAECIISGDKHLLDLKNFVGIPIHTPRQFLKRLRDIQKGSTLRFKNKNRREG